MTEDDTFRALCKLPEPSMSLLLQDFTIKYQDLHYGQWIEEKILLLAKHGWTLYEYNKRE